MLCLFCVSSLHSRILAAASKTACCSTLRTKKTKHLKSILIKSLKIQPIISHADHEVHSIASCMRVERCEGGVFSCKVGVSSSPVWGQEAAACKPRLCTPAGASVPFPEAARRTAAPPAGRTALEDSSSLRKEGKFEIIYSCQRLQFSNQREQQCIQILSKHIT